MSIQPTKFVSAEPMRFAGLGKAYTFQTMGEIPALWEEFVPHLGRIDGQIGPISYGLCHEMDDNGFHYLASVEVGADTELPDGFLAVQMPAQRYAAFQHVGHVSQLCVTIDSIWQQWLPESGESIVEPPVMFERYGEHFDPVAMMGDLEVWLAIK